VTRFLTEHAAHLAFVAVGVVAFIWTALRNPPASSPSRSSRPRVRVAPAGESALAVRRAAARRGLLALGPLLAAVGTGASLYALAVAGAAPPGAVVWAHAGVSLLALVLVAYKLSDLDRASLRRAALRGRLPQLGSLALAAVSVPLLVTGVGLLVAPSTSSYAAYSHLVAGTWWTALLAWHLRRYVGASLRALGGSDKKCAQGAGSRAACAASATHPPDLRNRL
jgi:hypothetical protein